MKIRDVSRWWSSLNPLRDHPPESARRGRLAVGIGLILCLVHLFWVPIYFAVGLRIASMTGLGAAAIVALGLYLLIKQNNLRAAGHAFSGAIWATLCAVTWETGHLESTAMGWLLIPPMLATLLVGRYGGLTWAGLSIAWHAVLLFASRAGLNHPVPIPEEQLTILAFLAYTSLVVCAVSVIWSFEVGRTAAMERLAIARDESDRAHQHARSILDNVGDGLVMLNQDGTLQPAHSTALARYFKPPHQDQKVWDLLDHDEMLTAQIRMAWAQLSTNILPQDVALEQFPDQTTHAGRAYRLRWLPAGSEGRVMFVASDVTAELEAEEERAEQTELVNIVARSGRDIRNLLDFANESRRLVDALAQHSGDRTQELRWIHTLKGNSSVMGLHRIAKWLHNLETQLGDESRLPDDEERRALNKLWSAVERRIRQVLGHHNHDAVSVSHDEVDNILDRIQRREPYDDLRQRIERWRWDDAEPRLAHLGDQAMRIAQQTEKTVAVEFESNGVRTPPTAQWRELWTSLVHLVRNAMDHGLEVDRAGAGKSPTGTLLLAARRVEGAIELSIRDDGAGIDWSALEERARRQGRSLETEEQRLAWLFSDGVTTKETVTELSGRGVGTSAVMHQVTALGGSIVIDTAPGSHTQFTIHVPDPATQTACINVATAAAS